ncbi:hypothetical protein KX75_20135 [Salmonella enterica subsp. enterica]|nr:hypothetical protein [Salmonella enterica subsp. enterica serovar Mikawasima]EDN7229183.1 hypothetical protein [Salmonella enterica subsp. enterica serovar Mikawasima]
MSKVASCGELIVNGEFNDTSWTGWSVTGNNYESPMVVNGHAQLPNDSSISQSVSVNAGNELTLSFDMSVLYGATAYAEVLAFPSETQLYYITQSINESGAVITVPDGDNQLKITFACKVGGEVDVDNVSLTNANSDLIIGGDFSDASLPGWTADGGTEAPMVVDGHLQLPDASNVYQDVTVTSGCTVSLSYSMQFLYSATGNVTVTGQTTGEVLYQDTVGGIVSGVKIVVPDGENTLRITFNCILGGEVDVDNVSMVYV